MSLNRDDVERIAHLARLNLTAAEVPIYAESLSRIMDFVGQLESAETGGIEPMAHPLPGLSQPLRPDQVLETDHRDRYQQNAPRVEAGLYVVPRVIE